MGFSYGFHGDIRIYIYNMDILNMFENGVYPPVLTISMEKRMTIHGFGDPRWIAASLLEKTTGKTYWHKDPGDRGRPVKEKCHPAMVKIKISGCFDYLIYFLLVIHVTNLTNPINNSKQSPAAYGFLAGSPVCQPGWPSAFCLVCLRSAFSGPCATWIESRPCDRAKMMALESHRNYVYVPSGKLT
jgi:hypothetical protein